MVNEEKKDINLQVLVKEAESVYDEKERARREGSLWIDRRTNRYMITLGAIHGLHVGSRVQVFRKEERIGEVEVDTVFDVLAYVQNVDIGIMLSKDDYYTVKIDVE